MHWAAFTVVIDDNDVKAHDVKAHSTARTCAKFYNHSGSSECNIYDLWGRSGCDRYYSETIQNNKFVTIVMYVSAPVMDLIEYSSRYI